jgi:hydrogenase maturation protease
MARVLIVGYGNPLKSDDSLGWRAAEEIVRQLSSPEIKVMRVHQLMPEMAEEARQAELAIFIDARQGKSGGEIGCEELTLETSSGPTYSHDFSPPAILQLARELYGSSPRAYLLTVSGECFEDGETLSPAVAAALPQLIARVKALIS